MILDTIIKVYSFEITPQHLHIFETCANPKGMVQIHGSYFGPILL